MTKYYLSTHHAVAILAQYIMENSSLSLLEADDAVNAWYLGARQEARLQAIETLERTHMSTDELRDYYGLETKNV